MARVATRRAHTGAEIPVLGQGTWEMGARRSGRDEEVRALRLGLDLGLTMIDTAEMYAGGGAEKVVGEAIRGCRDRIFLVSKVLPENASRTGTVRAAERSLERLGTEVIDLYLLHWEGSHPLGDTLAAFVELRDAGKIRYYGVSNLDVSDLERCERLPGGNALAADQVLYNLERRGIERGVLPWCSGRGVLVMAYSPLMQARLEWKPALRAVASRHGVTPAQVALAWTLRDPSVVTIVKAAKEDHLRENAAAATLVLDASDLASLDREWPQPSHDVPLETL